MGNYDKKHVALFVIAAAALVALFFTLAREAPPPNPEAAAVKAAQQDVQRMYEEDLAAAKASAEFNAQMRQAEMEAAENMLNAIAPEPAVPDPVLEEEVPPAQAGEEVNAVGQSNVLSRDVYVRGAGKAGGKPETKENP